MTGYSSTQHPQGNTRFYYGYTIVAVSLVIMTASFGIYFSYGVFFIPLLNEFGWTRAMTSGAFSLSMIISGLLGILMGGLTDKLGARLVMTVCGVILGLGYYLMAQVTEIWQLYLYYGVIIGIGMSSVWVPLMSTVARWFAKRRTLMSGIVLTGTGIGALVVPPLANWLISTYNWRISFIIIGSAVLIVIVVAAQLLRRDPGQVRQAAYYGNEETVKLAASQARGLSLNEAIHTRQFWLIAGMFTCFGICLFAIMVHIAPHAIAIGISPYNAANILAVIGITVIIGRIILGTAADKIGDKKAFIIGFIMMLAGLCLLLPAKELWVFYLYAAIFGLAHGGMGAAESPIVAGIFGLRAHGLILGATSIGFTAGGAIGPLLAGYVFDITGSYQVAFLMIAAIVIMGLFLTAILEPIKKLHS
jgi:MFS family permease